jgi:metal-dependent hydrolase (beta-lactamase superfamily II)
MGHPKIYPERSHQVEIPLRRDELSARLSLNPSTDPQEIAPGVWTTGAIDVRTEFEGRSKELLIAVGGELVADAYRDGH